MNQILAWIFIFGMLSKAGTSSAAMNGLFAGAICFYLLAKYYISRDRKEEEIRLAVQENPLWAIRLKYKSIDDKISTGFLTVDLLVGLTIFGMTYEILPKETIATFMSFAAVVVGYIWHKFRKSHFGKDRYKGIFNRILEDKFEYYTPLWATVLYIFCATVATMTMRYS